MQDEFIGINSIELGKSSFAVAPKSFNAINIALTPCKFIVRMEYSIMLISIKN